MRNTQFLSYFSHFIFKKFTQRFQQFHFHVFRKSAYVVMRFNYCRRSFHGLAFDNIRINSSLSQKFSTFKLVGLFIKNSNKFISDGLSFFLRIRNSFQFAEESFGCVHHINFHVEMFAVVFHYFPAFILSQKSGVYENTG